MINSMKNIFGLVLVASILMLPSCEIPADLNDNPNEITDCHKDMRNILDETSDRHWEMGYIERHEFYQRAKSSYAVVCAAAERRPYGCFIFTKGVIGHDGKVI